MVTKTELAILHRFFTMGALDKIILIIIQFENYIHSHFQKAVAQRSPHTFFVFTEFTSKGKMITEDWVLVFHSLTSKFTPYRIKSTFSQENCVEGKTSPVCILKTFKMTYS